MREGCPSRLNHPDQFQAWHFRGKVIGTVAMEVFLAIFTVGYSLGTKVVAKVGKYFPKLAKVLNRILAKADDLIPKKADSPRTTTKGQPGPDNKDFPEDIADEDRDWYQTLAMARIFTEAHDLKDTPVKVLNPLLNGTFAATSGAVKGYDF